MSLITRNQSVLTNKPALETLYTFKKFPTYVGCVTSETTDDVVLDLTIDICKDTGILQVRNLAPIDQVYLYPHNDAIGATWQEHNQKFIKFIERYLPKKILEIGGGSGKLATGYTALHPDVNWTILDPNPLFDESSTIHSVKEYFSPDLKIEHNFDAIIHSHVLEHQSDIEEFFENISHFLVTGGLHIFSIPNLYEWLSKKYLNCINFEHTILLADVYVDCLLQRTGYELLEKTNFRSDHSIFYVTRYTGNKKPVSFPNMYKKNKYLYLDYVNYYETFVNELNEKLYEFPHKVFLFGAHIFSQYLLAFGLNQNKISGILDNSKLKIDKRLYGTNFQVFHPEIIKNNDVGVILKVGSYRNEIVEQLRKINPSATIFE